MSGVYKDPKLSLEPVVVLKSLQLKQHASHPAEGQELTCRENRQSCFQLYNPSSPLVTLIRKRDSAVSKMSGNVNVVTSPQHRRKSLLTGKTKNPDQSIKTYIKEGSRSKSPGRFHKCSLCPERFHTSTLLAAHKRIHDQETDDEDTDIDVDVEETDHIIDNALNDLSSSDSTLEPQNYNNDDSHTRLAFNTKRDKSTSNSSDRTVGNFTLRGSSVAYSQRNKCLECPATFTEEWYLQLHMILLHFINKNSISCPGCSANCETEQRLRQHIQSHHRADLQFMNYDISRSLGLSVDSLTGERLKPGEIRRKPQRNSWSVNSAIRKDVSRVISKVPDKTQPVISRTLKLADPVSSVISHTKPVQVVTSGTLNFGQKKQDQPTVTVTPKLLNLGVMKQPELIQPMTSSTLNSCQKAQARPSVTVSPKLVTVISKLSKQLKPVFSISGKSVAQVEHVSGPSPKLSAHPSVTAVLPSSIACNWRKALPPQKDLIIDLVEAEIKYIISERSKLGDHFSYSDIQRLSLQVCDTLKISQFFDGSPPKRWAQRILAKVRQIPRPGRFRFVHNFNVSYVNAASELCAKGLTERDIFYVFEARLWVVRNGKVCLNPSLKTHQGAIIPDESLEQSMGVLLSFNAEGSRFLQPYLIYQGKPVQACNLHSINTKSSINMSKELVECDYFCLWLSQFLQVIHERPILLLVEGDVTHLSYSLIKLARKNNVHILFLPSKKRFVHSHRLIMESVLFPYVKAFNKEMEKYTTTHPSNEGILLNEFGNRNDEALMNALHNAQIRRAFVQAGFLPLPPSVQVLEDATQDYLRGVDIPTLDNQTTQTPYSPVAAYHSTPSLPSPLLSEVKEEPVEFQLENVKQETVEDDLRNLEIKQEPIDFPQDDFVTDINAPQFETVKIEVEDESDLCPACGDILSSTQSLTDHQCEKDCNMEDDPLTSQAPFICGDCGSGFNEKNLLRNHNCHFVDNEEVFTCPLCDSQFFDETALLKHRCHLSSSLSDNCELFTCHHCGMSFALKNTLDFHLSMHDEIQHRHHQTPVRNSRLRQTTTQYKRSQQTTSTSTPEDGRECLLSIEKSKSSSRTCDYSPYAQRKKQARMDSPSSITSSRTMSPAFSDSSRTLTASPCELSSSSSEQSCKEGGDVEAEPSKPGRARWKKLPPPPLPEHDYLGQIYLRKSIKSVQKVIINSNSSRIFRIDAQSERPFKVNCLSIATKIRECAKDSTPNQQSHPLSRKRTKKVQRRQRRLIALIQRK